MAVRASERGGGRRTGPEERILGRKNRIRSVGKEKKEKGIGPKREKLGCGKEEKQKEREWAGLKRERGKELVLHFLKLIQTIQFNSKSNSTNSNLN